MALPQQQHVKNVTNKHYCWERRCVGGNPSRARKWYRGTRTWRSRLADDRVGEGGPGCWITRFIKTSASPGASIVFLAYGQIHARNLIRSGGERFAIPSMGRTSGTIKPLTRHCDSQIHARNPKGLAEGDLLSPCGRFLDYYLDLERRMMSSS